MPAPLTDSDKRPDAFTAPTSRSGYAVWGVLVLLLMANLPIFLCLHLTCDTALYDVQARCVLDGGVLYQDMVEPNLPGVVWIHMFLRTLFGWSTVVIRAFDLVIMSAIAFALGSFIRKPHEPFWSPRFGFLAVAIFTLHFGLLEWCHCQRDAWMLLPCLLATRLRFARLQHIKPSAAPAVTSIISSGITEGVVWGIAFWIKPHIAIPALTVIGASWLTAGRSRQLLWDACSILMGGLLIGAAGSIWLMRTGAWSPFWDMQLHWNPVYVQLAHATRTWSKLAEVWQAFSPWNWFHLGAIGVTFYLTRHLTRSARQSLPAEPRDQLISRMTLLAALYLGWCFQALTLQFAFMYVFYPTVLLAIALVSSIVWKPELRQVSQLCSACAVVMMLMSSSLFAPARYSSWIACVTHGPTWQVRSRIQVEDDPNWGELGPVVDYLQAQHVQDGEVTAYSNHLVQLYEELGIQPSTKFVFLDVLLRLFPARDQEILTELKKSRQRFVVTSLHDAKLPASEINGPREPETLLPVTFPKEAQRFFPYTQPVVFRSGRYLVHEVSQPLGNIIQQDLKSFDQVARSMSAHVASSVRDNASE